MGLVDEKLTKRDHKTATIKFLYKEITDTVLQ